MRKSLLTGAIITGCSIAAISVIGYLSPEIKAIPLLLSVLIWAIWIFVPSYIGLKYVKSLPKEEFFSFGKAYKYALFMLLLASPIELFASISIYLITPLEVLVAEAIAPLESMNMATQEVIDQLYVNLSDRGTNVISLVIGKIFASAIFALFVALIIRKKIAK